VHVERGAKHVIESIGLEGAQVDCLPIHRTKNCSVGLHQESADVKLVDE